MSYLKYLWALVIVITFFSCDKNEPDTAEPPIENPALPSEDDRIPVSSVDITADAEQIVYGKDIVVLSVKILPEDATDKRVEWSIKEEDRQYIDIEVNDDETFTVKLLKAVESEMIFTLTAIIDGKNYTISIKAPYVDHYLEDDGTWHILSNEGFEKWLEEVKGEPQTSVIFDCDIKLTEDWTPINSFSGSIDGNGHTILGLNISSKGNNNAFICTNNGGIVKNLNINGVTISGSINVGAFVGTNKGIIENCILTGEIKIDAVSTAGGIVGLNSYNGIITNCHVRQPLSGSYIKTQGYVQNKNDEGAGGIAGANINSKTTYIKYCSSEGLTVTAERRSGGIVGNNNAYLYGCYSSCEVNCVEYAAGGVVGRNYIGKVAGCYSTGNVSGPEYIGGIVGRNEGFVISSFFYGGVTNSGTDNYAGLAFGYNCKDVYAIYCKRKNNVGNVNQSLGYTAPYCEADVTTVISEWGDAVDYMNKILVDNHIEDFRYVLVKGVPQLEID